jgi:hypothetical protein
MRLQVVACVCCLMFVSLTSAQDSKVTPAAFDAGSQDEASGPVDVTIDQLGSKFRLIGKLKAPLGEVLKVQGLVVAGTGKEAENGPEVRIFRIGKQATQEFIQLKLTDYYGRDEIPNLEVGRTFEFEGYETGGFIGIPAAARKRAGEAMPASDHRFVHEFVVFDSAEIKLQPFTPADFIGRDALLQGRAVSEGGSAYITAGTWKLLIDNGTPWPKSVEGKTVEARGVVRTIGKTTTYRMENSGKAHTARLVSLGEQLGRQVSLLGALVEKNGQFAFRYRGALVQVENIKELAAKLNATDNLQLTGVLDQATVQIPGSASLIGETETRTYYIVRKATLKPTEPLLAIERAEPVE